MLKTILTSLLSILVSINIAAQDNIFHVENPDNNQAKQESRLFSLSDVRVTDEQMKHLQDLDHDYLLSLDTDRLLSWFRREAGLPMNAEPYPYWESEDVWGGGPLSGHIMGFYLSSMAMMYQSTGDQRIIDRLRNAISGLKECQQANGNGYLLATPGGKQLFDAVAHHKVETLVGIRAYYFNLGKSAHCCFKVLDCLQHITSSFCI